MLHLILGGCGTGKSYRLMQRLRDDLLSEKTVLLLVPEQFSFEAEKKLYAFLGAALFDRLRTYSFATLSGQLLQRYAPAARSEGYASEQEKLVCLYRAVRFCVTQKSLYVLERRCGTTDFISALSGLITKLRQAGITAETLLEVSQTLPGSLGHKTHDIGMLLSAYDRFLREQGRHDSLVNLTEAAELANMELCFRDCHIYIDEFDSFTGDQYRMLTVLLEQAAEVTAAIRADDPAEHPTGIFVGGNHTALHLKQIATDCCSRTELCYCPEYVRSAHADLTAVSTQILRRHTSAVPHEGHLRILAAGTPEEEVEFICAEICRLLREEPALHCSEIAVIIRDVKTYAPVLARAMERYALPYDMALPKPVIYMEPVRHLLVLLELLTAKQWQTEMLLRYLKSPFSGFAAETVPMLEHFCFTWSIDGEDWTKPFWKADTDLAERAAPFGGEALEMLRIQVIRELSALRNRCADVSVRSVCSELYAHLCRKKDNFDLRLDRADAAHKNEFTMLWNLLCDTLDTLVDSFDQKTIPLGELCRILTLLIRSSSVSTPPQTLDSIRIMEAQTARPDSPAVVFVPCVSEGVFPGNVDPSGLFTAQELQELDSRHLHISRLLPELHSDELLIVNKILAAPTQRLYLTYPAYGAAGERMAPSPVIDEIQELVLGVETEQYASLPLTFFVCTPASAYYHYVRRLREDTPETAALRELLREDPVYAPRLEKLTAVPPSAFPIAPEIMRPLLGTQLRLSPSGIEQFYGCAFAYYCSRCLRLYVPEQIKLSAQSIGSFTHFCLEQLLRDTDPEVFLQMTPDMLLSEIRRLSGIFSARNFSDAIRRDGRFRFQYRMVGQDLLGLLRHIQSDLRSGQFKPAGFEVNISPEEGSLPPLLLRDGEILCQGKIDRVDICRTGHGKLLRIIDYKTGSRVLTPEKLAGGLDMQMLLYLFALEQSNAYEGAAPSGVLYLPSGQLRQNVYEERAVSGRNTEEILDAFYRMKGLVTEDALPLMEQELQAAVPVMQYKQKDELFLVGRQQLSHLKDHVMDTVCAMADRLCAGDVAPEPYPYTDPSPCSYCRFSLLCGKNAVKPQRMTTAQHQEAMRKIFGTGEEETT